VWFALLDVITSQDQVEVAQHLWSQEVIEDKETRGLGGGRADGQLGIT